MRGGGGGLLYSKFGVIYSNFLNLTPTFWKGPIQRYGKTPNFSGSCHFYSCFQNPSESSGGGGGVRVDVNKEMKFLCKLKKIGGRVRADVNGEVESF